MKIVLKNSNIVFAKHKKSGWYDVTADPAITSVAYENSYMDKDDGSIQQLSGFTISEIRKDKDALKLRVYARFASALAMITFRNDAKEIIGSIVNMGTEGHSATDFYTVEKDWPAGATKAWVSYQSAYGYGEQKKFELFY